MPFWGRKREIIGVGIVVIGLPVRQVKRIMGVDSSLPLWLRRRMIVIGRKSKAINYEVKLEPIYIDAMEANQFYMNDYVNETGKQIKFKLGKDNFVDFNKVSTRKAVINDSLFLRYMESSITRNVGDICNDFVVLKFNYDVDFIVEGEEIKRDVHELRNKYYEEGITIIYDKKNKESGEIEPHPIYYKMLMRSTGKAKKGECVFIRDSLYHKAINFLTMGLYDLMDEQSKKDPEKVFRLVELSAYQTLTTATSVGYIQIPLENILILKDEEVYSDEMKAAIVSTEDVEHEIVERVPDFDNSRFEELINKKGFTFDEGKAKNNTALTFVEKSKRALKENGKELYFNNIVFAIYDNTEEQKNLNTYIKVFNRKEEV